MDNTGTSTSYGTGTGPTEIPEIIPPEIIPDFDMLDELLLGPGFSFPDPNPLSPIPSPSLSPVLQFLDTDPKPQFKPAQTLNQTQSIVPIKDRLSHVLKFLHDSESGQEYLVQIWVPTVIGDQKVLTTTSQPYQIGTDQRLVQYRSVSQNYHFSAEESSGSPLGLPGRVFVGRMPEWTPDVRLFKEFEYPRVGFAEKFSIKGTVALPVFERGSGDCVAVVELVMTRRKICYGTEIESICNALQAVDLRSSEVQTVPRLKPSNFSYQTVIPEIQAVIKTVCQTHNLPLAQTWIPCIQQGKSGNRHTDENFSLCISTVDSASYARDPSILAFHQSCSDHHLFKGEGIAGQAFLTNQPVFSPDITGFSKIEYSLAHHAKLFNLRGAVAIRLRSVETGKVDFVLEFFLPFDCREIEEQRALLDSLSVTIQRACCTLRVVTLKEMDEELNNLNDYGNNNNNNSDICVGSSSNSWISSVLESPVEAGMDGFSVTPGWDSCQVDSLSGFKFSEGFSVKEEAGFEGFFGESSLGFSGDRMNERKHNKTEKNITLQDLRKHFAGSLKDAAKNLGVCPTTLKRICRQHGISRWPSRKIKKVGHSLKKLQLVIDSVHGGPEGPVQLSSLYENFTKSTWSEKQQLESTSNLNNMNNNNNNSNKSQLHESSNSLSSNSSSSQSTVIPVKRENSTEVTQNFTSPSKNNNNIEEQNANVLSEKMESKNNMLKIKAIYGEEKVIFRLQPNWGFGDLQREVAKRFGFTVPCLIDLKYLDDESEWVLLTCDADLHECLDVYKLSSARTIKISVCPSSAVQSQPFVSGSFYHMGLS